MIDVSVMSNEDLAKIITEAKAELEQREYVEKERAWDRLHGAIVDYLERYDIIEIKKYGECTTLEKGYIDLSEIGVINFFD